MRRLIAATLLLTALPLAAAEVYRSIDENGNVVYSDRPVPGAELVDVEAPFLGGGPAQRQPLTTDDPESAGNAAGADDAEQRAEQRAALCEDARDRQQRYATSRRLYRETPDGERYYLTSEEIDEARAQAAADVEQWCN